MVVQNQLTNYLQNDWNPVNRTLLDRNEKLYINLTENQKHDGSEIKSGIYVIKNLTEEDRMAEDRRRRLMG